MRFWDTSALVPLVTKEEQTPRMQQVIESDRRGRRFDPTLFRRSLFKIAEIEANWTMLDDFEPTIKLARQLITKYVLRTGDAIQLAAACGSVSCRSAGRVSCDRLALNFRALIAVAQVEHARQVS